jgi:GT2 family glycosyltransferase
MKLLVVVLCYRVPDLTIDCLRSLDREVRQMPGTKVAVCENGTGGDAPLRLRGAIDAEGWSSWCELTVVYPNRGFCGGNNLIIRPALESDDPPEYVLLLNADTIVLEHALKALVDFMESHPEVGIAGSQFLSPDGQIQSSPFRFMGILSELDRGLKLGVVSKLLSRWSTSPPTPAVASEADWVSGASMILRRSTLEQIGLLDEGLYTYFDDIDICLRARRAGWKTWYVPESRIIHFEGASTGVGSRIAKRRPDYWYQARRRFLLKSYGTIYAMLMDAAFICGYAMWRLRRRVQRKEDTDPPFMLADSIRHSVFLTGFRLREVENPAMRAVTPVKQPFPDLIHKD